MNFINIFIEFFVNLNKIYEQRIKTRLTRLKKFLFAKIFFFSSLIL